MTAIIATPVPGKVNRFEAFHHHRKQNPAFYRDFEVAMDQILLRHLPEGIIPARVLRDTLSAKFPNVKWTTPGGVDVFKAMLAWYRHRTPESVKRFRARKTEKSRAKSSGIDWNMKSKQKVKGSTILLLRNKLMEQKKVTTMTLLKQEAGVKFNQNFNSEVSHYLRTNWPESKQYLPVRRPRIK